MAVVRYEKIGDEGSRVGAEIAEVETVLNMDNLLLEKSALEDKLAMVNKRIAELVKVAIPVVAPIPEPVEPEPKL